MSVVALSVLCVLLLGALVYRERAHSRHVEAREKTWDLERGALLNRIQHPEVFQIPAAPPMATDAGPVVHLPEEPDESALVGTIQTGEMPDA